MIEKRQRWYSLDHHVSYFESHCRPHSWNKRFRFLMIRTQAKQQQKGSVQLDLFVPYE